MTHLHIRPIRLRKWFPPRDPVATAVAMLCILREDFLLELYGITNEQIDRLDDNARAYRRTYFWRNSLRTLEEIRKVMNRLNAEETFREAMSREGREIRAAFEDLKGELNRASGDYLRELRNAVGAHLDEPIMRAALDDMDHGREALIEVGQTTGTIHYKFATDLLWSALLREVPAEHQIAKAEELLGKSASLMGAVHAIDHVVMCYLKDRKLP